VQCLSGEWETCIQTLEKAVELEPDDAQGRYWLGLAYQQDAQKSYEKAEEEYLRALRADPDSAKAHLALGGLYQGQPGMEALAFEEIQKALSLAVQQGDEELELKARSELARYFYAQDNYALCVDQWHKVLEERPGDADAHRRLGLCYAMRRDPGDLEAAIESLERALQLDFEQIDAYYFYLGQYYASEEDYARAFMAWDQFLRFSEDEGLKAEVREMLDAYRAAMREEGTP
jgi:tetratricopeptide (TPR) repeat protein